MNKRLALLAFASALLAAVTLGGRTAHALQDGPACAAAKKKLAGKKDLKLLTCDSVAVGKGGSPDTNCTDAARNGFSAAWAKAEAKGGCFTSNDESTIEGKVDTHVQDLENTLHLTGATASKCTSKKFKDAGKKGLCLLICHGKAQRKGVPLSDPLIAACMQKCRDKFSAAYTKDEALGDCRTTGDTSTVEGKIDTFADGVASMLPTGVATTTTTSTTVTTIPPTRCCQATGACFDAAEPDAMVKCPLLNGTLAPSGRVCNGQTGTCGTQKVIGANCCQCPANPSQFPHPQYCFDTNISSCGNVCTKTVGAACGPNSETCGGP